MTEEDADRITSALAIVCADWYLEKPLTPHISIIQEAIYKIGEYITSSSFPKNEEVYYYWVEMAYLFYRYRDIALGI